MAEQAARGDIELLRSKLCRENIELPVADFGILLAFSRRVAQHEVVGVNAQAESLWSRLKTEELERREWPIFADLADAQASVTDYFDYYNHERLHPSIGYQLPYLAHQKVLQLITLSCPA